MSDLYQRLRLVYTYHGHMPADLVPHLLEKLIVQHILVGWQRDDDARCLHAHCPREGRDGVDALSTVLTDD